MGAIQLLQVIDVAVKRLERRPPAHPRRRRPPHGPLAFLARNAIPAAAILMPAGFFLSAGAVSSGPTV
jgi:hypothetical protein